MDGEIGLRRRRGEERRGKSAMGFVEFFWFFFDREVGR